MTHLSLYKMTIGLKYSIIYLYIKNCREGIKAMSSLSAIERRPLVPARYPHMKAFMHTHDVFSIAGTAVWILLVILWLFSSLDTSWVMLVVVGLIINLSMRTVHLIWSWWFDQTVVSTEATLSGLASRRLSDEQKEVHNSWWRSQPDYRSFCSHLLWLRNYSYSPHGIFVPGEETLRYSSMDDGGLVAEYLFVAEELQAAALTMKSMEAIRNGLQRMNDLSALLEHPTRLVFDMGNLPRQHEDQELRQLQAEMLEAGRVEARRLLEGFKTFANGRVEASRSYAEFLAERTILHEELHSPQRAVKNNMRQLIAGWRESSPLLD